MAASKPEVWTIDGKAYQIDTTYYLALSEGFQYTIETPWTFESGKPMDDAAALTIAFPLIQHAFQNNLYKRMQFSKVGEGQIQASRIGVALVERQGPRSQGYRVALSLPETQSRIETEKNQ